MNCRLCGAPIDPDRVAIGKDVCMARECTQAATRSRLTRDFALVLMPKQGFTYVSRDTTHLNGRSSGR